MRILLALGVVLLVAAAWLAVDSPSVEVSHPDRLRGPDGRVGCVIAPYDTVLNGTDASPGGTEHSYEFSTEVDTECTDANRTRFYVGSAAGALGLGALVTALVLSAGSARRRRVDPG